MVFEKYLYAANDFIAAHPNYGLMFAFLVAFAESLPILGTLIPGSFTMTLIGVLVGRNLLPLGLTLLLGFIGAILGDLIGFGIGIRYQGRLHTVWPFSRYEKLLKLIGLGEIFFQKHGGKSVVIGRFIGPTRSSVPLIAGLLRMRWANFIAAAIPSAFLWALLYLLPGVLIGAISLSLPKEKAATFTLIGFGIIVALWLTFWALQRFFAYLFSRINDGVDYLWQRLRSHSPILKRWLTTKTNPKDHHQLTMAIFALVFWVLFTVVYYSVHAHAGIYALNNPVFYFLQSIRNDFTDRFFVVMTELGETPVVFSITGLVALALAYQRNWRAMVHLLGLMLVTATVLWIFKHAYYHPRPSGFMRINKTSSFPSGHTTFAVTLFGFLAYLNAHSLKKYWLWLTYTVAGLVIVLVSFSRLTLGAHWFCDVIAGLCLGVSLLLIALVSYRREEAPRHGSAKFLLTTTLISILLPWSIASAKNFHRDFYHYTTFYPRQLIKLDNWWHFPTAYVPLYRENRLGKPIQPLNVQWAGELTKIRLQLMAAGWLEIDTHENLQTTLQRFATKRPEDNLAFLPVLYRQKPPALFMIKHPLHKKGLYELRLWEAGIDFTNGQQLYVGSINYHKPGRSYISLKPALLITLRQGGGIYGLAQDMAENYDSKKVSVTTDVLPRKVQALEWDRNLLLLKAKTTLKKTTP